MAKNTQKDKTEILNQDSVDDTLNKDEDNKNNTKIKLTLSEIKKLSSIRNVDEDTFLDLLILNDCNLEKTNKAFTEVNKLVAGSYLPSKTIVKYMKYIKM